MIHLKKNSKHTLNEQQTINNLALIERQIAKRIPNPDDSNYCNCNICLAKLQLKERGRTFMRQTSSNMKIKSSKMQQFMGLICAVNNKIFMKLDIPQICFFSNGDPRRLFKSNNSGVHQIELTPNVKKNLIDVYLDSKKVSSKAKTAVSLSSDDTSSHHDSHLKNFSKIVPSFKHGQKIDTKKAQTFIFHNDTNFNEDQNFVINTSSQSQQICIVKCKDKQFELMNEKQLRQTLKSLVSLQNVQFIQSYIKPNEKKDRIFEAVYSYMKGAQNQLMWNRSLTQIKIDINLINKFSKDYVSLENLQSYQSLLKEIPIEYCLYQTYKMIHYMQLVKDVKVQSIGTLWLKNQIDEICFFGLSEFQWQQNPKLSVDVGEIQELKEIMSSSLSDFENELLNAWEHMKDRKIKPQEKLPIDHEKEQKLQLIKKDSVNRVNKEKQQSLKRTRRQSGYNFNLKTFQS